MEKEARSPPGTLWAYAYEIVPPQGEDRMDPIRTLLEDEHAEARRGARRWAGRMISEQRVTHILVVSDSPDQGREVNRRLEERLKKMEAGFSLTPSVPVSDEDPPPPPAT